MKPTHHRVSRDTRVLLTIVVIAVAILWALARLRFPDRLPTPNPVPPVLAQLTPPSAFDDITSAVAQLQTLLQPSILGLTVERRHSTTAPSVLRSTVSALRFRDDFAVALIGAATDTDWSAMTVVGATEVARDRASQLAVVRLPGGGAPLLSTWAARRPSYPRFLIAADATSVGLSLRPVFVGSLREIVTPIWSDPIWALPDHMGLASGTFVFTVDGALAGLVVEREGRPALATADAVVGMAERLAREGLRRPGRLGVEVQPLSTALAAATGASVGVVVTWVDLQGPAARELRVADVIECIDGNAMPSLEHWSARVARLTEGESLVLRVRRGGEARDVGLIAGAADQQHDRPLGLALRTIPGIGVEILRVDAGSAAAISELQVGDVLTVVGDIEAPNARQASRVFATASPERSVIVGVTRAGTHRVLAIERTW